MNILSQDLFIRWVAEQLELDEREIREHTFEELAFDSLQLFELDLLVEDLGVLLDEADLATSTSILDLYRAYVRQAAVTHAESTQ